MALTAQVAIVEHVSECDVKEIPGGRLPYDRAVAYLAHQSPRRLRDLDLVYVQADGTLGRYASWSL